MISTGQILDSEFSIGLLKEPRSRLSTAFARREESLRYAGAWVRPCPYSSHQRRRSPVGPPVGPRTRYSWGVLDISELGILGSNMETVRRSNFFFISFINKKEKNNMIPLENESYLMTHTIWLIAWVLRYDSAEGHGATVRRYATNLMREKALEVSRKKTLWSLANFNAGFSDLNRR